MMTIFIYTQPYKGTTANIAEAVLSILTTLLLQSSIDVFPDQLFLLVIEDTKNSTCLSDNGIVTLQTLCLVVFYYVPLMVTICLIVHSLVKLIR